MALNCYFIATSYGDNPISQHFQELAKTLSKSGNRVIIITDGERKDIECHSSNPSIYTWPSKRPVRFRDAWFLLKLIQRFRPDCLIANFGSVNIMMLVGWLMQVAQRLAWYHTLSDQIDMDSNLPKWKLKFLRWRKRIIYKMANYIVPVSESARDDVALVFNVPTNKCKVFYNSLTDPFDEGNCRQVDSQDKKKIVCVGRLHYSKGQDILIRAMAMLTDEFPDHFVEFVGDGPAKDYYLTLVSQLKQESRCIFIGSLSHSEVIKKMTSAYVTIVPSRSEAFGLVIIESMAVGTPVIGSKVGGIPEIIIDGSNGYIFPSEDHKALAGKLRLLFINPDLQETMGKQSRKDYCEKFEKKKVVREEVEWLANILNRDTIKDF